MRVEKIKSNENSKLFEIVNKKLPFISYNYFQKILRNKDIKLNGKRVNKDSEIFVGDEILIYIDEKNENKLEVLFEDENIVVLFKKRGIETVSDDDKNISLFSLLKEKYKELYAVHRLDRNTSGIVVFAKNLDSKNCLDKSFKEHTLEKFYIALVYGKMPKEKDLLEDYLKKDEKKSLVYISNQYENGYQKIKTEYSVIQEFENSTKVEVKLLTGRTHQIRAHFSYIGHFVIGDEKYGDSKINKIFKKKYQCLTAYKIIFHFLENEYLNYLDKKEISLDKNKIDF